jgi:uncharacterized membrane protein YfcA
MEALNLYGFVGALVIGTVLGLTGGGGSILTVPVLVYLLSVSPVTATAYSLFIVGSTALVGTIRNAQKGMIEYKVGIVFAIPSFISVFLTRKLIVPSIPEVVLNLDSFIITKDMLVMIFFAVIMLAASISMLRERNEAVLNKDVHFNYPLIIIEGLVIGLLTGLVGAGGGFLIIPALVLFANLPIKKAVATSLMIIAIKSLIGFLGDIGNIDIAWDFLLTFAGLSMIGIILGIYLNNFIDGKKLKKGFGWFVLAMAIYILLKELI